MATMRWCKFCQDWIHKGGYNDHMQQHKHEMNLDEQQNKQYLGSRGYSKEDYMICVLHQKKLNGGCPVPGCTLKPFGAIRKSWMLENAKKGIFHTSDNQGNQITVPIDKETRTIILMGATIHLKI